MIGRMQTLSLHYRLVAIAIAICQSLLGEGLTSKLVLFGCET